MFCACMVTAIFYGTGKHEANLTEEHILIAKRVRNVQLLAFKIGHVNIVFNSFGGSVKFLTAAPR
jgi:hypothetical protein